jgi:hypothetical protein
MMFSLYNSGFESFERGERYRNPYRIGTSDFDWFERGYFQAQKLSDCHFTSAGVRKPSIFSLLRESRRHLKDISQ